MVAGGILAVVGAYFLVSAVFFGGHKHEAKAAARPSLPLVQTSLTVPTLRPYTVLIRGRTEAARIVSVRSETSGVVAATPVREGSFVQAGQLLCKLNVDARQANLDQTRADLRAKQLTHKASAELAAALASCLWPPKNTALTRK